MTNQRSEDQEAARTAALNAVTAERDFWKARALAAEAPLRETARALDAIYGRLREAIDR